MWPTRRLGARHWGRVCHCFLFLFSAAFDDSRWQEGSTGELVVEVAATAIVLPMPPVAGSSRRWSDSVAMGIVESKMANSCFPKQEEEVSRRQPAAFRA